MKERKEKSSKTVNKGFTLIELLVVVLIIGILAAIALSKYQLAVGKSQFATLKNLTRSIAEARNRYFLVNSEYPKSTQNLDIDIEANEESYSSETKILSFYTSQDIKCTVWLQDTFHSAAACQKKILGKKISFYIKQNGYSPYSCTVFSEDKHDIANQMCAKETGKPSKCSENGNDPYCVYQY